MEVKQRTGSGGHDSEHAVPFTVDAENHKLLAEFEIAGLRQEVAVVDIHRLARFETD
jgi:hypothetical protein